MSRLTRYRMTIIVEGADRLKTIIGVIAGECSSFSYEEIAAPKDRPSVSAEDRSTAWLKQHEKKFLDALSSGVEYPSTSPVPCAALPGLNPSTVKGIFPILARLGKLEQVRRGVYRKP